MGIQIKNADLCSVVDPAYNVYLAVTPMIGAQVIVGARWHRRQRRPGIAKRIVIIKFRMLGTARRLAAKTPNSSTVARDSDPIGRDRVGCQVHPNAGRTRG